MKIQVDFEVDRIEPLPHLDGLFSRNGGAAIPVVAVIGRIDVTEVCPFMLSDDPRITPLLKPET